MPKSEGFDPIELSEQTEKIVVDGNKRKYVQLGRSLRFYGGTTSATEVGCNLRCKFCFSDQPVWNPKNTGKFYSPQEVFDGLAKNARKNGHQLISASASEGTIGLEHLYELLDIVEQSEFIYILETNGINIGSNPDIAEKLAKYSRLHVRLSIKGCSPDEFHTLTGAKPSSYELQYLAIKALMKHGISFNVCLVVSFSDKFGINFAKHKLTEINPGIIKSLEIEKIKQFPKVKSRLRKHNLIPNKNISCAL
jgi:uncharacterized Fe-S cluster-containing radical SAM superfamily protein